jgi:hypothetical protein
MLNKQDADKFKDEMIAERVSEAELEVKKLGTTGEYTRVYSRYAY